MYKLDPVTPPNPHRTKPPGPSVKPPWYATGCRRLVDRFSSLTSIRGGDRGGGGTEVGGSEGRGHTSYPHLSMAWWPDAHRNAARKRRGGAGGGVLGMEGCGLP